MHGDFDWSQIAFLIMVVVVGFIRWLGSAIQKNKEQVPPLTEHEKALREEAWRRQTGQGGAPPLPQGEGKEFDPWGELRDLFKPETGRTAPPLPPPATTRAPAPPTRAATPPVRTREVPSASEYRPHQQAAPQRPPTLPRSTEPEAPYMSRVPQLDTIIGENAAHAPSTDALAASSAQMKALQKLLHNPNSIREAILLREILGPPKALQNESTALI